MNKQEKQPSCDKQGEPVVGTKTWFEDGKVITQNLTAKDLYKDSEPAWTEMQCPICGDMAIPTPQPKQEQRSVSEQLGEPVGIVESAIQGAGGFHVKLTRHVMPTIGETLYTTPYVPTGRQQRKPLTDEPKAIRVWGWVWKDKRHEGDLYVPSYTPAQHVPRGELLALVDPADLHNPLENTKWHTPAAHGIKE